MLLRKFTEFDICFLFSVSFVTLLPNAYSFIIYNKAAQPPQENMSHMSKLENVQIVKVLLVLLLDQLVTKDLTTSFSSLDLLNKISDCVENAIIYSSSIYFLLQSLHCENTMAFSTSSIL